MAVAPFLGLGISDVIAGAGAAGGLTSAIGGLLGKGGQPDVGGMEQFSMQQMQMQEQFAREMAQNSISWRVADAKNAGISPLVALGAPVFNPSVSGPPVDFSAGRSAAPDFSGFSRFGAGLGDLAKGIDAKTMMENKMAFDSVMQSKQLQQMDADIGLKGAQAAYWSMKAQNPAFPPVAPQMGGLGGQQLDRGFGSERVETPKNPASGPDLGTESGAGPNSLWKFTSDTTVQRVPRDAVTASANVWNPEYLKWQGGTINSPPPPMEALPPGAVRWVQTGLNSYSASPYYPWERGNRGLEWSQGGWQYWK